MSLPLPAKEDKVQVVTNDKSPFLNMKISWSPERGLQFGVFRGKRHQLKYVGMGSTDTPGTLRVIPSGGLNRLAKLTSQKLSFRSEGVNKIYPDHANALCKVGLAPTNLQTMG